jgi:hypothetical protein
MERLSPLWKSVITLVCLLPFVAGLAYWAGLRAGREEFPRPLSVVEARGTRVSQGSLREARQAAAPAPRASFTPSAAPAPAASPAPEEKPTLGALCESSWARVAASDPRMLEEDLLRRLVWLNKKCLKAMREDPAAAPVKGFVETCQARLRILAEEAVQARCVPKAADFRSFVIWQRGEGSLAEADTAELANQLTGSFLDLRHASRADIERSLAVADALLARNPDMYAAHKAKLVALMLKELKFKQDVDPAAYENAYSELLSFAGSGGPDPVAAEREGASGAAAELSGVDPDLVHLPFVRLEAQGNFEASARLAQEYLQAYPNSYVGYYYLASATWAAGDEGQAVTLFRRGLRNGVSEEAAREMLARLKNQDPLNRLYGVKLE